MNFGRIRSVSPSPLVSVSGALFFAAGRLTIASRPTSSQDNGDRPGWTGPDDDDPRRSASTMLLHEAILARLYL
jgi:hypothetical protein